MRSFRKKLKNVKELDALRAEIDAIKKDPFKKIDPNKKEQLKQEIASVSAQVQMRRRKRSKVKISKEKLLKMKENLAKLMKDLEQAEDEWELMKEPEKFATMVVKQGGSGTGGDLEPTFIECHEKGIRVYEENGKHYEVPSPRYRNMRN